MNSAAMSDATTWLTWDFWSGILQQTVGWAIVSVPKVLVVLVLAAVLLRLVGFGMDRIAQQAIGRDATESAAEAIEYRKRIETLLGIVSRTARVVIWGLAIVLVLMQIGVDVAPIVAGAGILGIAVGFGAQELVRDVVTGFFQLLENHVRKGDVAIINGTGGVVESMGLRTIVLRDLSGVVHVFQNGKVSSMANMTKTWSAMVFEIGVAYKEDIDIVIEVMRQVADELQRQEPFASKILEPIEIFGVESFDDSAVIIKARIKTVPIEQWTVGREYRKRLKYAFDRKGIEIPFPHRTLYWGDASRPFEIVSKSSVEQPTRSSN